MLPLGTWSNCIGSLRLEQILGCYVRTWSRRRAALAAKVRHEKRVHSDRVFLLIHFSAAPTLFESHGVELADSPGYLMEGPRPARCPPQTNRKNGA